MWSSEGSGRICACANPPLDSRACLVYIALRCNMAPPHKFLAHTYRLVIWLPELQCGTTIVIRLIFRRPSSNPAGQDGRRWRFWHWCHVGGSVRKRGMVNLSIIGNVLRIVNCVALELPHICHVKYNNCQPLSIKRGNIDLETLLFLILVTVELPRYLVQAMVVVLSRGWNVHK